MTLGDYSYLRRLAKERGQNAKLVAAEKDFQKAVAVFHYVEGQLQDQVARLKDEVAARDLQITTLTTKLSARDRDIQRLSVELGKQESENARLKDEVAARDLQITTLTGELSARDRDLAHQTSELNARDGTIACLSKELADRNDALAAMRASFSWRITTAPRWLASRLLVAINLANRLRRGGFAVIAAKVRTRVHMRRYARLVEHSGLFDRSYYLAQNPDVVQAGVDPLRHYFIRGVDEGRDPHPLFDASYYLSQNPDVAKAGVNPLVHYLIRGAYEGRDPHPHFDSSYYLEQNPDVAEAHLNPLAHYVGPGIAEGRDPNPYFDTPAYLDQHPEVALKGLNPLVHHLNTRSAAQPAPATSPPRPYEVSGQFNLCAALHSEFEESGRVLLDSEYDSYPLVSIIIPCFNHGNFLEHAVLSSLLACSHPLEIIVVDDGSTDPRSVALIDELAAKYKFTLVRQANTGRAAARNTGIQHARGKFIQFLDADDLLAPGKIDIQVDEFRSDPEIDVCISEYELCDAEGLDRRVTKPSTIAEFSFSKEDFLFRWERGLSIPIHCALFRRELLEKTHFRLVTHSGHEDWIFWVELSSRLPKFKFKPAVLATYRIHGQNTVNNREEMGLDFLRACMHILQRGLNNCEGFLQASIQHFQTAYLGSIKHEAILWSRGHPVD